MANDHKRAQDFDNGDPVLVLGHGAHGRPRRAKIERLEGNVARVLYEDTQLSHRVRLANIVLDPLRLKPSRRPREQLTATIGDQIARKVHTLTETQANDVPAPVAPTPLFAVSDPAPVLHAEWCKLRLSEWIDVFHTWREQPWSAVGALLGLSIGRLVELRKANTLAEDDELVTIAVGLDAILPGQPNIDWLTTVIAMRDRDRAAGVREQLIKVKPGRKHGLDAEAAMPEREPVSAPVAPVEPIAPMPEPPAPPRASAPAPAAELTPKPITVVVNGITLSGAADDIRRLLQLGGA
jgi:hypothetical protein